jgi:hypothetical protein
VLLQTTGDPRYLRDWDGRAPNVGVELALTNPSSPVFLFNAFRGSALGRYTSRSSPSGGSGGTLYEVSGSSSHYLVKFRFTVRPCPFPAGCP